MKTLFAGVALVILVGTTALAAPYIVQDSTKRCRIVEDRSGHGLGIVAGRHGVGGPLAAEIIC